MGKQKKTGAGPGEPSAGSDKYSAAVKFRPSFKEKLERVADDLDKYPGQLVEEHMEQFINQENLRILREELEAAEAEAKRLSR